MSEEASPTDKGLMGFAKASSVRKPSDGQPFKNILSSVAGQEPRGPGASGSMGGGGPSPMGGAPAGPMSNFLKMMRKR